MLVDNNSRINSMIRTVFTALIAVFAMVMFSVPAEAQRRNKDEEQVEGRALSAKVGESILKVQEFLQAEPQQTAEAIAELNKVLAKDKLSPYEKAIAYQMRGSARYATGNIRGTIADWEAAVATGALIRSEIDALMPNVGQLWIVEEEYVKGATILEQWIATGGKPNAAVHTMIAQAWAQAERYRKALPHAEASFRMANPKQKKHFDLLNYLYNTLKMYGKQASLLEQQVSIWPDDKSIWRAIASLKAQADKSREAFEINKIMYLNGMLTDEQEILNLTQYYSYYEVPYRGAKILEREMNAGRVAKNKKNLTALSEMWRQAREYDKAIPVLTQAADASTTGALYVNLGEAYLSENRYSEAEAALRKGLAKGGVKKPGNVYLLIADALYKQDKPRKALLEFEKAKNYSYSRKSADGWMQFIYNSFEVERNKLKFRQAVKLDECKNQEDRVKRMGGTKIEGMEDITEECVGILAAEVERIEAAKQAKRAKAS